MTDREEWLQLIVDTAVSVADGADGASIVLVQSGDRGRAVTTASAEPFRSLEQWQHRSGQGPSVEAIRSGQEVTFVPSSMPWWRVLGRQAEELGIRAAWSTPVLVSDSAVAALSLYSTSDGFPEPTVERGRRLAHMARILAATGDSATDAERLAGNLRQAVVTRDVIGQAKGILMARQNISAEEAFDALRRASQRSHRKLSEVAAGVVERHEQPLAASRCERAMHATDTGRTG